MVKLGQESDQKTTYQLIIMSCFKHDRQTSEAVLKIKKYLTEREYCERLPYIVCVTNYGQRNPSIPDEGIDEIRVKPIFMEETHDILVASGLLHR